MRNTVLNNVRVTLSGVALVAALPWHSIAFAQAPQPTPAPLSAPTDNALQLPAPLSIDADVTSPQSPPQPLAQSRGPAPRATTPQPAAPLQPGEGITQVTTPHSKIRLRVLDTLVLETVNRIRIVDGFDEALIKVQAISPHRIRLAADAPGVTNIKLVDEFDVAHNIELFVEPDTRELQAYLERLFPGSAIEVVGLKDAVVLRGWVTQPLQIPEIIAVAEQFYQIVQPQLTVAAPNMVQLQVHVIEVQRSTIEKFGMNFGMAGKNYLVHSGIGDISRLTESSWGAGASPSGVIERATSTLDFAITGRTDAFRGFIEALRQQSLAEIKASPILVTTSGRPATYHSGGKFPIQVAGGLGTNSIQWKDYGVSLQFVPLVLGQGRLRLDVSPEVSERDYSTSANVNGQIVPSLTSRKVDTQVEMMFGETLMIGGMIFNKEIRNTAKVPFLGDLPWIGAAFSRKSSEMGETELLILVTPQLVSAMKDYQVPSQLPGDSTATPTFKEFMIHGSMEVPSFGPDCPNGDCGQDYDGGGYTSTSDPVPETMVTARKPSPKRPTGSKIQQAGNLQSDAKSSAVHAKMELPSGMNASRATNASSHQSRSNSDEYLETEDHGPTTKKATTDSRRLPGMIEPKSGTVK